MALSPEELARRHPVWVALSELFLDSEPTSEDLRRIAGVLDTSGYSDNTLNHILHHELAPFLLSNLLSVAGIWGAFDETWVCEEAQKSASRSAAPGLFARWWSGCLLRGDWNRLQRMRTPGR